jgi:hypothetical protein
MNYLDFSGFFFTREIISEKRENIAGGSTHCKKPQFSAWVEYCKRQENVTIPNKEDEEICGHCLPCIWAVPEVTTRVVPSLVHLHHAEFTM